MGPGEIAAAAHHVEMDVLGWQCGIQDQLCAAYGGINFIEMHRFPDARVTRMQLPDRLLEELERRLVLIYLGASHRSSDVHRAVIRELEDEGPECRRLNDLRQTAARSRDALLAGDLDLLGSVMIDNTEAQRRLHPGLIGSAAQQVIDAARIAPRCRMEGERRRRGRGLGDDPVRAGRRHSGGAARRHRALEPVLQAAARRG